MTSNKKFDEATGVANVVTTTTETPAEADKTSVPNALDGKHDDPPVRTHRPDVPIAQTLADGAGRHVPFDDPHMGADGRWYADTADARNASVGYLGEDELDARYGKAKTTSAAKSDK